MVLSVLCGPVIVLGAAAGLPGRVPRS